MEVKIRAGLERIRDIRFWFALLATAALAGCNYNNQTEHVHALYADGNLEQAALEANKSTADAAARDKLVYYLEEGAIQRAAGHLAESQAAMDNADKLTAEFESQAKVRLSQHAVAIALNPTATDYRGNTYDRIMMNTYKALDALEMGDLARARVELVRAYQRQQDAVEAHKEEIADAQKSAQQQNTSNFDESAAANDPQFQQNFNEKYSALNVQDMSGYANYVNPFTEYLRGIYLMAAGVDASDLDQAAAILRRISGIVKDNGYVAQDAVLADEVAHGQPIPATTYVLFETGLAPWRKEILIPFPLIFKDKAGLTGSLVEAAFPFLVVRDCQNTQLTAITSGGSYNTAPVCDMDKVVSAEFKSELPLIITEALISAGAKAAAETAADVAVDNGNSNNELASVLVHAAGALTVAATTHADTRAWKSLPKLICVARFATPSDRNITLRLADGRQVGPIHLVDGTVNVVYVKMLDTWAAPVVRQFKLK